jgi:polyisoprenoid-binding protein YceI
MTRLSTQNSLVMFIAMALGAGPAWAEEVVRFASVPDKSSVRVDGTSTLHDWTVKTPSISGHIDFSIDLPMDATAQQIREAIVGNPKIEAAVEIAVDTMKSVQNDKKMDKKMYEALKRDRNPSINYKLTKFELAASARADQEEFEVRTTGDLSIAGATRELQIPMVLTVVDSQHLRISGSLVMKMTDFNVNPPEALLGMIKSGDRIKVAFEWNTARAAEKAQDAAAAAK